MDELITRDDVRRQRGTAARPTIVDVRGADEYAAGHLPGAINIPADDLQDRLGEIPEGRPVVTYCNMRHPGQSRGERAADLLREHGLQARALEGGFPDWQSAGLDVERGAEQP